MPVNLDADASTELQIMKFAKQDAMLHGLVTKTPAEVYVWIENNVTDLATAKEVLKRLAAVIAYLVKDEL